MSWNYRIIYHPPSKYKLGEMEEDIDRPEYLAIHEVYYDDQGNPDSMTIDEIVTGDEGEESLLSLKWILEHMLEALDEPILNEELANIEQEKQNEFSKSIKSKEQDGPEDLNTSG